jgi:hypothetical protein
LSKMEYFGIPDNFGDSGNIWDLSLFYSVRKTLLLKRPIRGRHPAAIAMRW